MLFNPTRPFLLWVIFCVLVTTTDQQQCDAQGDCVHWKHSTANLYTGSPHQTRYLLYDVNHGEGFNLRRDVYMRMASLVRRLGPDWVLVLPEWCHLPHWTGLQLEQESKSKRWSTYFDLDSMSQFAPVLEMDQFVMQFNGSKVPIDSVLSLEHSENFHDSEFVEMYEINELPRTRNYLNQDGTILNLVDYSNNDIFEYRKLYEIKMEGFDSTMSNLIVKHFADSRVVLVSNAEVVLHSNYGDRMYWQTRRSMRFAESVRKLADDFRSSYLNSNDRNDATQLSANWQSMHRSEGDALGGPYLAVHFRRNDFIQYRASRVPDLDCALLQIHFVASNLFDRHIENIYIATDAEPEEWTQLKNRLEQKGHKVFNYAVNVASSKDLTPGEVAIIDQWVCAHAQMFVGTLESTFSYQIQEEREILGFNTNTTFNALCPKCDLRLMLKLCKQESTWTIVY